MASPKIDRKTKTRLRRLAEAVEVLTALQCGPKQRNEIAAYTLLALLDLPSGKSWAEAGESLARHHAGH